MTLLYTKCCAIKLLLNFCLILYAIPYRKREAAQISLLAYREDISLKDAALKLGFSDGRAIRPMGAARGHDPSSGVIVTAGRKIAFVFQTQAARLRAA